MMMISNSINGDDVFSNDIGDYDVEMMMIMSLVLILLVMMIMMIGIMRITL